MRWLDGITDLMDMSLRMQAFGNFQGLEQVDSCNLSSVFFVFMKEKIFGDFYSTSFPDGFRFQALQLFPHS